MDEISTVFAYVVDLGWPVRRGCVGRKREEGAREMRKLIVSTFLTLDGVMQAPGGPGEDDSGGFAHGGWSVNYWDEQMGQVMGEAMSVPFDLVLGRKTYDIFAAYWPHAPEEAGAKPLNDATKYVASRSHPTLEWSNSVLIEGDAAEGIAALKKEDGPELQVHGSGNLLQTLLRHNLVDQFRLCVFLVIGSGKRLFSEGTLPSGLRLVDNKVSTTGVVIGTYEPAARSSQDRSRWTDRARNHSPSNINTQPVSASSTVLSGRFPPDHTMTPKLAGGSQMSLPPLYSPGCRQGGFPETRLAPVLHRGMAYTRKKWRTRTDHGPTTPPPSFSRRPAWCILWPGPWVCTLLGRRSPTNTKKPGWTLKEGGNRCQPGNICFKHYPLP